MSERDARIEADRVWGRKCRNGSRNVDIEVDGEVSDTLAGVCNRGGMIFGCDEVDEVFIQARAGLVCSAKSSHCDDFHDEISGLCFAVTTVSRAVS